MALVIGLMIAFGLTITVSLYGAARTVPLLASGVRKVRGNTLIRFIAGVLKVIVIVVVITFILLFILWSLGIGV